MDNGAPEMAWTRARVETRLIAAFRAMPSCPIFRRGPTVRTVDGERNALTAALEWAALLELDPDAKAYLWAWASCRARKASFGEHVQLRGWKRSTAEAGRRRGAILIAKALSKDWTSRPLDIGKTRVGSLSDGAARVPADA